jgi:glycosyltransferase involved in cell wall biosynthesis
MRIAEIAPPWLSVPPKGYGGTEWVVANLTDGLVDRGHDVTLFATGDSRTKAALEFAPGLERAPGPAFINSAFHDTLHTVGALRDLQRFDVLHLHSTGSALAVAAHLDRPTVVTVHGSFTEGFRRLFSEVADRMWFVAISHSQRSHMPGLRYAGVVHNGIDVDAFPFREDKEDYLLFLGRAAPEKGVVRAIRAAKEAGMPLKMAVKIAGEDEVRHWERDVEPELTGDVEVLDEVSDAEKLELLSRARAVLFPIEWEEPFGLVMTEAMACGTPVIATPRGAVPEVVADGQTGFVVPVEDYPRAAARAIDRLHEIDPRACRGRVERLFSVDAMVEGYERAFDRALRGA